jgi:predicted RND superfamily exporter protein
MDGADEPRQSFVLTLGLERLGQVSLRAPKTTAMVIVIISVLAAFAIGWLKVDDSLSELFRNNSQEFHRYEEIDRRFPSSEYDVLVVVESANLLQKPQLEAFRTAMIDLQLADGVNGLISMLSARGKPDATGYAAPIVPDVLPDGPQYDAIIKQLKENDIVAGKFLSSDGTLALAVISLDRQAVAEQGAKTIIGNIREIAESDLAPAGLKVQLTGAPVMQLEIRNAVERDQIVYNGVGLLFGAVIALMFFRRLSLTVLAALPPILAVVWSLGLLGGLGFRLNLFLNVMTPLVMVMGFADSMQMVSAARIRLREGDNKREALAFAVRVVGPACVIAHSCALLSFLALLFSDSALIRTFGEAGALATLISYFAVIGALPLIGLVLIRNEDRLNKERTPTDAAMDNLSALVGWIVDHVVHRPVQFSLLGLVLLIGFSYEHLSLQPRYRLADQVPDREQSLKATSRLDQKLTGANPVHVMIQWHDGRSLYDPTTLAVIEKVHDMVEKEAGLGNVWSLESLRRWLREAGDDRVETIKRYVDVLPEHLVRRFIAREQDAVLVTGRLPDVDASQILPVIDKLDKALNSVRAAYPSFTISVTGLPAIAARNSANLIRQLDYALGIEVLLAAVLLGLAFRAPFIAFISLLPSLFPVVATGSLLAVTGEGLEFASMVALIVIFGLGIDSLIHFLNRLRREEKPGEPATLVIRRARVLVGPAIILTTIVLAFGLGVTMLSDLPSLRLFGAVCAVTLVASLIGDLVFLPATVALYRKFRPLR